MAGQLRHMLRDDDINHAEQKQILELGMKFRENRFYRQPFAGSGRRRAVRQALHPHPFQLLHRRGGTRRVSAGHRQVRFPAERGEPVADTARVLTSMAYSIVWRTFGQDRVEEMAKYATCPVVNALTDQFHPCQVLADLLTIAQHRGGVDALPGKTIAYLGDSANNMANSYLLGGATAGMNVRIAGPFGYLPDPPSSPTRADRRRERRLHPGHHRSAGGGRRRRLHLHRHVGVDGRGSRVRHPLQAVPGLSGERRAHGSGRARRAVPALPAGIPRQRRSPRR